MWKDAAKEGDLRAVFALGLLQETGSGVPEDMQKAMDLYLEAAHAANEGDCLSLFEIGWMSYFGHGCERSEKEAERLIRKSIEDGALMMLKRQAKIWNAYAAAPGITV